MYCRFVSEQECACEGNHLLQNEFNLVGKDKLEMPKQRSERDYNKLQES